ncbi:MAG: hypothetical protein QM820_57500 [Minicystis sp.]
MVLTWFAGVHGLTTGFANAMFLREGRLPDLSAAAHAAKTGIDVMDFAALVRAAELSAMLTHVKVTFPLAVAEAMLGGLLVIGSGLAMGGRRGARSLALQVIAANALLAIAAYLLTRGVRTGWIEVVMGTASALPEASPQRAAFGEPATLWWAARIKLIFFDLGPLALGVLALSSGRTRTFFDAVAHATESAEDP